MQEASRLSGKRQVLPGELQMTYDSGIPFWISDSQDCKMVLYFNHQVCDNLDQVGVVVAAI